MKDAWASVLRWMPSRPFLEAVGALVIKYNDLEFALYGVLWCFIPEDAVPALYYELHNTGRVNTVTALARDRLNADQRDALAYGLKCFNICAENRNLIAHAMADSIWAGPRRRNQVFVKAVSGRPGDMTEYVFRVEHIRAAAISIDLVSYYLGELVDSLSSDLFGEEGDERLPLPDRPLLPRKLSLHRRPEPREVEPSQRRSSAGKSPSNE